MGIQWDNQIQGYHWDPTGEKVKENRDHLQDFTRLNSSAILG
jgi:hypothetical protein